MTEKPQRCFCCLALALTGLVLVLVGLFACNPLTDVRNDCKKTGQMAIEECTEIIDAQIEAFKEWLDSKLAEKEREAFVRLGCSPADTPAGWICPADSPLCLP